ncbi:MAG TPA: hypothetical protein VMU72_00285 [Gaiellaceae bacterium]|nr:hypothetical protein [Gaiellaceae bacterium]
MRWIALPLICAAVAGAAATAATARSDATPLLVATTGTTPPLATGIADPLFLGAQATTAYALAKSAGATYARFVVSWASIAPKTLPVSGFDPTDPTSPYYDWSSLDASVSAAHAVGITPILDIVSPPSWAYSVPPGAWTGGSPKIADLRAFATAIATHYDGLGPAPASHVFSVWNEPNYNKNLFPQSASYYRAMVNAVADAVHGVDPSNLVVAGELAPFRHTPSGRDRNHAIPPLNFMRNMLCLSTTTPVHRTCTAQAKFDVWAHHPYSNTGPYGKAKSPGGVELGDLPKMNKLLQTAERLGAISSARPVQFWVTEIGWSSKPPNSNGVPMLLEARWLAESMYQIWKSGATVATWFSLEDRPPIGPLQSGLYFRSPSLATAQAKPLLTPFRFPLVAYLQPHGAVFIWGRDATDDKQNVTIQQQTRAGRSWQTVATITSNNYGIFQATLSLGAKSAYSLRASVPGLGYSRPFSLTVPRNESMDVTPFPRG